MENVTLKQVADAVARGCVVFVRPRCKTISINGFPARPASAAVIAAATALVKKARARTEEAKAATAESPESLRARSARNARADAAMATNSAAEEIPCTTLKIPCTYP